MNPRMTTMHKAEMEALLQELPVAGSVLEIGTYEGTTIARLCKGRSLVAVCVDPFLPGYDDDDAASKVDMEEVLHTWYHNTKDFPIALIRQPTARAAKWLLSSGLRFDLILIDGCHQYAEVMNDYATTLRCSRSGGVIAFHDYSPKWPGVQQCVDELQSRSSGVVVFERVVGTMAFFRVLV